MYKINLSRIPVFLLFILCVSCKKDNEDKKPLVDPPVTYDSYAALKTGNYWICQIMRWIATETVQRSMSSIAVISVRIP